MPLNLQSLGFVTNSTPGTPVPLASSPVLVTGLRLQPRRSASVQNVGNIYIITKSSGGKGVSATIFAVLFPEQVEGRDVVLLQDSKLDLSQIYLDVDNSGDGVLPGFVQPGP